MFSSYWFTPKPSFFVILTSIFLLFTCLVFISLWRVMMQYPLLYRSRYSPLELQTWTDSRWISVHITAGPCGYMRYCFCRIDYECWSSQIWAVHDSHLSTIICLFICNAISYLSTFSSLLPILLLNSFLFLFLLILLPSFFFSLSSLLLTPLPLSSFYLTCLLFLLFSWFLIIFIYPILIFKLCRSAHQS